MTNAWRVLALSSLLASLECNNVQAFTPTAFLQVDRGFARTQYNILRAEEKDQDTAAVDVSIPYDAPARLAYDNWRAQYNKGDFDLGRYEAFKNNFEGISVANVMASRKEREQSISDGNGPAVITKKKLQLNENADMTLEEYEEMQAKKKPAASESSDPSSKLDGAVQSAMAQSEASMALVEASAALEEEEEALARQLGLDSVEELEIALDSLAGIAEDGGELDTSIREARVRSVYLDWAKTNGKEPDEKCFQTFSTNFLAMEEFSKDSGKEMVLNEFADLTEEEYIAATQAPNEVKEEVPEKIEAVEKEETEVVVDEPVEESAIIVDGSENAAEVEAAEAAKKQAEASKTKAAAEKGQVDAAEAAEKQAEASKVKAAAEKAQMDNAAAAQAKTTPEVELDGEEAVIFAAKAEEERMAELNERTARWKEEGGKIERAKAKEAVDTAIRVENEKKAAFKKAAEDAKKVKDEQEKKNAANFSKSASKSQKSNDSEESPAFDFFSIFKSSDTNDTVKSSSKPSKAPASAPKKAATKKAASAPSPTQAPKKEPFSFFKKPAPPPPPPAPAPAPKGLFSFLSKPEPPPPPPAPAPAPKGLFSFLSKPAPPPPPPPPPAPKGLFSFLSKPAVEKTSSPVAPKSKPKRVQRRGTIAIADNSPEKVSKKSSKPTALPKDNIPVLKNWRQGEDGSLTGRVSNSQNFRDRELITTSSVRAGAKAGMVVRTQSGSKYRLT